jgi:hypothetical protein
MEDIYETPPNESHNFTFVTRSQILEGIDPEEKMLLHRGAHKLVAKSLEVPELAAEVERAIRQVEESYRQTAEQKAKGRQEIVAPIEEKEQKRK